MTVKDAVPCLCGRTPRLVQTGGTYGGAWDGGFLFHYELQCPRWFFKCQRVKKNVSKGSPWYRWREDLADEWNAAIRAAAEQRKVGAR
ncbi:MAG: hypothetical protein HOV80_36170 [Polyangiaceae bacterium]|nr:hypothetical protein [Polyangiaceae bacterium]